MIGERTDPDRLARRLRHAAWLALILHVIAGLAMAGIMRFGLASNPDLAGRMTFLVERTVLWRAAWSTWTLAAFSILYFYVSFARAHWGRAGANAGPLRLAVILAAAAVAFDLLGQGIQVFDLPDLALLAQEMGAARSTAVGLPELFIENSHAAETLSGLIGNTLYTVAAVILIWVTRRVYPRWIVGAGWGVCASGAGLSLAAHLHSTAGMVLANVFLMPCLLLWLYGVARD